MDYEKLAVKVAEVLAAHPAWTNREIADELNARTMERPRPSMTGDEILNATDMGELAGLSVELSQRYWSLLGIGALNPHGRAADVMGMIFTAESATITALKIARMEPCSWADLEEMPELDHGHIVHVR